MLGVLLFYLLCAWSNKCRGINAVTNFEMELYDVEAISSSSLHVGLLHLILLVKIFFLASFMNYNDCVTTVVEYGSLYIVCSFRRWLDVCLQHTYLSVTEFQRYSIINFSLFNPNIHIWLFSFIVLKIMPLSCHLLSILMQ